MKRRLALACLLLAACAVPCAAQKKEKDGQESLTLKQMDEEERNREQLRRFKVEPGGESLPPALMGAFKPVELPEAEGAWAVQLITRGGLMGGGRGDVTVTSFSPLSFRPPGAAPYTISLPTTKLTQLSQLVAAARPSKWKGSRGSVCRDCYVTLLVLQRRERDGGVKTYTAHWDDTTALGLPADLKDIAGEVYAASFATAPAP